MVELLQKFGEEVRKVGEMRTQMGEPCSSTLVKNETDEMEVTVSNRQPLLQTPNQDEHKIEKPPQICTFLEATPFRKMKEVMISGNSR